MELVICCICKKKLKNNNNFSSLALTDVTTFTSVKPQVPPLECGWTITFQVFTSLPKYSFCPLDQLHRPKDSGSDVSISQNTGRFPQT